MPKRTIAIVQKMSDRANITTTACYDHRVEEDNKSQLRC